MKNRRGSNRNWEGLTGKKVLLIVTGGIAAYKSAYLVRLLKRGGAEVRVVLSEAAVEFVTPLTFEVLSGNPVPRDLFAPRQEPGVEHVELASWAERVIVAPATADFIAKAALGMANDLASAVLLASRCPVYLAPAMNEGMWENPAVQRNISALKRDGRVFIEPGTGELACGDVGSGRMAEPEELLKAIESSFAPGDLADVRVLVTAGRTEEEIDPVRYISNRSSGRMGFALASIAKERGAHVSLIYGPVDVPPPIVDSMRKVTTSSEMKSAVMRAFPRCDVLVMAAAVADYTPMGKAGSKMKRGHRELSVELRPTVDILASLKEKKRREQVVVGFALETDETEREIVQKIRSKGCDYLVLNMIGEKTGFSVPTNRITLFKGTRRVLSTPLITKEEAASLILDRIASDRKIKRTKV